MCLKSTVVVPSGSNFVDFFEAEGESNTLSSFEILSPVKLFPCLLEKLWLFFLSKGEMMGVSFFLRSRLVKEASFGRREWVCFFYKLQQ